MCTSTDISYKHFCKIKHLSSYCVLNIQKSIKQLLAYFLSLFKPCASWDVGPSTSKLCCATILSAVGADPDPIWASLHANLQPDPKPLYPYRWSVQQACSLYTGLVFFISGRWKISRLLPSRTRMGYSVLRET